MQTSAEYINKNFKEFFSSAGLNAEQEQTLLNIVIDFGRVTKYRCRSNSAYRNFLNIVFNEIAEVDRTIEKTDKGFEVEKFTASISGPDITDEVGVTHPAELGQI